MSSIELWFWMILKSMSQVVSWYQFTTNCGYTELAEACLNFIKWLLVALRWTIIHRLHLKNQFQVELHSGLHLNRLASPGTWFSSSHPWVQWSCYSGGLTFQIVLIQWVLFLTERNMMWSQNFFSMHTGRDDCVPSCWILAVCSKRGDVERGWGGDIETCPLNMFFNLISL